MKTSLLGMTFAAAASLAGGAFALAACGGNATGGGNTVTGTVAGTTVNVASAIGITAPAITSENCSNGAGGTDGGSSCTVTSSGQIYGVVITNRSELTCAYLQGQSNSEYANTSSLELAAFVNTGTVAVGTYAVVSAMSDAASGAVAELATSTATCGEGLQLRATSGSITLTQVSASNVAGTYSVTFDTQGTFSGSFSASICTASDGGGGSTGTPTCNP